MAKWIEEWKTIFSKNQKGYKTATEKRCHKNNLKWSLPNSINTNNQCNPPSLASGSLSAP